MKNVILAAAIGLIAIGSANAQQVSSNTTSGAQALAIAGGGGSGATRFDGSYTINNVPSLGSLAVALANSCGLVDGVQGVIAGGGLGFQVSSEGTECTRRAVAAAYWSMAETLGRAGDLQGSAYNRAIAQEIMAESPFAIRARQRIIERERAQQQVATQPQMASVSVNVASAAVPVSGCQNGQVPLPAPHSHICR